MSCLFIKRVCLLSVNGLCGDIKLAEVVHAEVIFFFQTLNPCNIKITKVSRSAWLCLSLVTQWDASKKVKKLAGNFIHFLHSPISYPPSIHPFLFTSLSPSLSLFFIYCTFALFLFFHLSLIYFFILFLFIFPSYFPCCLISHVVFFPHIPCHFPISINISIMF